MNIQWLAGFYEGEGSLGMIRNKSGSVTLAMYIYQKDLSVLHKIAASYGGTVTDRKMDNKGRKCGRLAWSGRRARALAKLLRPHIQSAAKARKLDEALATKEPKLYKPNQVLPGE